jgi:type 2 lantibiotic biosynthesis protein LanM
VDKSSRGNDQPRRAPPWWRARSLAERVVSPHEPPPDARRREQRWRRDFPDSSALAARLRPSGVGPDALASLLADSPPPAGSEPPPWWRTLEAALPPDGRSPVPDGDSATDAQLIGGCLRVVVPLVAPVRERLAARIGALVTAGAAAPLDPREAARRLAWPIALELAELCAPAIALELQAARAAGALSGADARERAAAFLREFGHARRARELLGEHPMLARLLHERLCLGEQAATELLKRLCADWDALRGSLLAGPDPGALCEVVPLGDPHDGARRVMALEFVGGARVLYKPRALDTEVAYTAVLDRLSALGLDPPVRSPAALAGGPRHGWQAWVEPQECDSPVAVERFFARLGAQLAVLHALRAVDVHQENVIAAGEHPAVVDLECLLHPRLGGRQAATADPLLAETAPGCVLRVGLLPRADEVFGVDLAGLGRDPAGRIVAQQEEWAGEGTDEPRREHRAVELAPGANLPTLAGQPVRPHEYVDALAAGFVAAHGLLRVHREALTAPDGPLAPLRDTEVRVILRPTKAYAGLLGRAAEPAALDDGLAREEILNALWRGVARRSDLRAATGAEAHDLWRGDVPKVTVRPGEADGRHHALGRLDRMLTPHRAPTAGEALADLDEADLERAQGHLRASVLAAAADLPPAHASPPPPGPAPSRARLVAAAREAGRRLGALSLRDGDQATWLSPQPAEGHSGRVLRPVGAGLAEGQAGMALFLAQLAARTGDEKPLVLAQAATRRLLALIDAGEVALAGPGLWEGGGGVLWALAHLAVALREDRLADVGLTLARAHAARVEGSPLDLGGGLAGWAVGLAATLTLTPDEGLRSHAERCAVLLHQGPTAPAAGLLPGTAGRTLALAHLGAPTTPADHRRPPAGDSSWATGTAGLFVVDRVLDPAVPISGARPGTPADHSLAGGHLGVVLASGDRALGGALLEEVQRRGLRCSGPGGVEVPGLLTGLAGAGWAWLALSAPAPAEPPDPLLALTPPRAAKGRGLR